jgi:hypothetical protein
MRRLLSTIAVVGTTLTLLAVLVHLNPFDVICDAMDRAFGAPPKWTQVTNVYRDPMTQEITHGDDAVTSLGVLKTYWHGRPGSDRVVFVGNSQMHSISLASGETPGSQPEKTYVDLVIDEFRRANPNELMYRLSSSGMSYPEVLWELSYMLDDPDLRPAMVILQMNYQAFWTGGIRDSLLPMLRRPSFRARIEILSSSGRADAPAYEDALRRFDAIEAKVKPVSAIAEDSSLTAVFGPQATPGYRIERRASVWVDELSPAQHRADMKESFENMLYRGRLYVLRLKPSTARSISGSRLLAARSAVDSIAALCAANRIKLLLFHAPVNPNVSLYRTPEDRESYREFVSEIAGRYKFPLFDFENSIGAEHWGHLLNGPDPLHMGRAGHEQMAKRVVEAINSVEMKN